MRVVHDPDGARRVLATDVDTADSFRSQTLGLMGRSSLPDDYALVFRFDPPAFPLLSTFSSDVSYRFIHMLFVGVPLDVLWLRDGEVVQKKTLDPWTGFGGASSNAIIELPAGAADGVSAGDTVAIEAETDVDEAMDAAAREADAG